MISKYQLLSLASPVQVGTAKVVFPTAIALMATDHHNSNLPDAGVIFNPLVLEGLTSDDVDDYVGFGSTVTVATELKTYYPKGRTPGPTELISLSMAQAVVEHVAPSPILKVVGGLINTPVDFWSSHKSARTTFTLRQSETLYRAGIQDLQLIGSDTDPGPWCAMETVVVRFQSLLPPGFPGRSPAEQAVNPWQQSGTIKLAQSSLAASLSPLLHIMNAEGSLMTVPAFLICDTHFGSPDFNNMSDLPLTKPHLAHLSLTYSLTAAWRDVAVIGISHNADVAMAISRGQAFIACAGGRPLRATNRTIPCEHIDLEIPYGQMKQSERFSTHKPTKAVGSEISVGFKTASQQEPA